MQPFEIAWQLLKGTLEEDKEEAAGFDPENRLQRQTEEGFASRHSPQTLTNLMSAFSTQQGIHEANTGDPNYRWQRHAYPNIVRDSISEQEMERERTEPWRYPNYQEPEGEDYKPGPDGLSEYDKANRPLPE